MIKYDDICLNLLAKYLNVMKNEACLWLINIGFEKIDYYLTEIITKQKKNKRRGGDLNSRVLSDTESLCLMI